MFSERTADRSQAWLVYCSSLSWEERGNIPSACCLCVVWVKFVYVIRLSDGACRGLAVFFFFGLGLGASEFDIGDEAEKWGGEEGGGGG